MKIIEDNVKEIGGLTVHQFSIIEHNFTNLTMPSNPIKKVLGISVYFEHQENTYNMRQYLSDLFNRKRKDQRFHFVMGKSIWQLLPLSVKGWFNNTNLKEDNTISILCLNDYGQEKLLELITVLAAKFNLSHDNFFFSEPFDFNKKQMEQDIITKKVQITAHTDFPYSIFSNQWETELTNGIIPKKEMVIRNFKMNNCHIEIKAHKINGTWNKRTNEIIFDDYSSPIDLFEIKSLDPSIYFFFRLGVQNSNQMLKWQDMGNLGQPIDRIQICGVKIDE